MSEFITSQNGFSFLKRYLPALANSNFISVPTPSSLLSLKLAKCRGMKRNNVVFIIPLFLLQRQKGNVTVDDYSKSNRYSIIPKKKTKAIFPLF